MAVKGMVGTGPPYGGLECFNAPRLRQGMDRSPLRPPVLSLSRRHPPADKTAVAPAPGVDWMNATIVGDVAAGRVLA